MLIVWYKGLHLERINMCSRPDFTLEDSNKSDLQAQDSLFQNSFPSEFEDLNFDESLPTKEDLEDDFVLPEESDFEKSLSGEDLDSIIEKTGSFSLDDLSPESQGSNENVSSDDFSIPSDLENPPEEKPSQNNSENLKLRVASDFIKLPELHKSAYYCCSEIGLVLAVDKTNVHPKNGDLLSVKRPKSLENSDYDKKSGAVILEI